MKQPICLEIVIIGGELMWIGRSRVVFRRFQRLFGENENYPAEIELIRRSQALFGETINYSAKSPKSDPKSNSK
ncbi:hypothetical protein GCM10011351_17900 [Paraliobacillus quinghaiensis]|uniref:Uncharacterized protein n=1 Tax=Paraliobacillus quinghaiensis TaxID=470815 RepID=A0A917WVB2_9BACI|nr:hypothetical protein [Paraliobacillus quinghaiensis]GGM32177.1 hypothetical protein GCM10011351_17900 [Paraliobacillus quinghaiensis]